MRETLRAVRAREYQKLWGKVPGSLGSALWIVEVAALGWGIGYWLGALTVAGLTILTRFTPSSWRPVEVLVDACYFTVMRSAVPRVMWLLLIADLWIVQGQGAISILMVLALFVASLFVPLATRRLIIGPLTRPSAPANARSA